MTVHRLRHEQAFFIASNRAAQDPELSWAARGLLMFMLSMPDDWRFSLADLTTRSPGGRDATRTALASLEKHGYVRWEKTRGDDGSFDSTLHVYEDSTLNPTVSGNPKRRTRIG